MCNYIYDFDILKEEICSIIHGHTVFNNVQGHQLGKKEREDVAKTALLRLDRIREDTMMLLEVCKDTLDIILKCSDPDGARCAPNESEFEQIRACLKMIKSALARDAKF